MPLSSSRRCIHHGDTAVGSMPVTGRSPNRITPVPGWTVTGSASPSAGSGGDVGGVDVVEVVGAGDFASHAAHRQAVAAVRRDRQVEHHVVEPDHIGRGSAGFGGAWRKHDDSRVVDAEVELRSRADHPVRRAAVGLAGCDREVPGQNRARQRDDHQIADREVGCPTDDVAGFGFTDVDLDGTDRLLELGELLDLRDAPDGQRPGDRPDGDDFFDLVADPDQRLLQLVGGDIPTRSAGLNDVAQPAVRKPHQAPTPNGSEKRTSPSTMSRMSGMPLRNCRVRSSPMPNANPE